MVVAAQSSLASLAAANAARYSKVYVNTQRDTSYLDLSSAPTSAGSPAVVSLRPNRSCIALIAPGWREGCDSGMKWIVG